MTSLLPQCIDHTGCGADCNFALKNVMEACASWLYSYDPYQELVCRGMIENATDACVHHPNAHTEEDSVHCLASVATGFLDLLPPFQSRYPVTVHKDTDSFSYIQTTLHVHRHIHQQTKFTIHNFPTIEKDRIVRVFSELLPEISAIVVPEIQKPVATPLGVKRAEGDSEDGVYVTLHIAIDPDQARFVADRFDSYVKSTNLEKDLNLEVSVVSVTKEGSFDQSSSMVLGIVLGVVLGVLAVAVLVAFAVFYHHQHTAVPADFDGYHAL